MSEWSVAELEICTSLDELRDTSLRLMTGFVEQGYEIHHVAGAVSADGDEHIARNLVELLKQRERVAQELGSRVVVITAPAVFTEPVYRGLRIFELQRDERETQLKNFWRSLLSSGLVSAVHFTPGWERSPGSQDEHDAARKYGISIHYIPAIDAS